ncbi:TolC family protein [Sulfurovum sp. ST-21]|uniref:TolC family protein n=1 Tax=Sulfurovum indicum TaxID=2779528 RepID=A0A7M1S224_9BACT|nr:TolC family protein [Sulfurovum indicum]QOR61274.1 TolC family protein [Sulfurovum indicum]
MTGKFFFLVSVLLTLTNADNSIIPFYKEALKTLSYQNIYILQQKSRTLSIEAKKKQQYLNLDTGIMYGSTSAKLLNHHFNNTDIGITDTIDLFGKSVEEIRLIQLQMKEDRLLLQVQKEKLFLSLLSMITAYRASEEKLHIYRKLYQTQYTLLNAVRSAVKAGDMSMIELTRLENTIALAKSQMDQEKETVTVMKEQLKLFSPHHTIPRPVSSTLHSSLHRFIANSPQLKLNDNRAKQSLQKIKRLEQSWIPDAVISANQQFNDDPTAYGNNYTLSMGLNMHFDGSISSIVEKQKVEALKIKSQKKSLEIERKIQYITWKNQYETAKKSFTSLSKTLKEANITLKNMRTAYLKHYIDLNTYLQTIEGSLAVHEAQINAKYKMIRNALILNTLSNGVIYE